LVAEEYSPPRSRFDDDSQSHIKSVNISFNDLSSNFKNEQYTNNNLSDVKSRLASMQRNKMDLEDKLRKYEERIKSHFPGNGRQ